MSRYETYKPSGIDWIGEVPEVWKIKRIKRIAEILRGASPRLIDDEKYFDDNGEFSWVRISDVTASETYLNETYEKYFSSSIGLGEAPLRISAMRFIRFISQTSGTSPIQSIPLGLYVS